MGVFETFRAMLKLQGMDTLCTVNVSNSIGDPLILFPSGAYGRFYLRRGLKIHEKKRLANRKRGEPLICLSSILRRSISLKLRGSTYVLMKIVNATDNFENAVRGSSPNYLGFQPQHVKSNSKTGATIPLIKALSLAIEPQLQLCHGQTKPPPEL